MSSLFILGGGRLKGILVCSVNIIEQGGWAFIEAGAFIRAFTVCLFHWIVVAAVTWIHCIVGQ